MAKENYKFYIGLYQYCKKIYSLNTLKFLKKFNKHYRKFNWKYSLLQI